MPQGQMPQGQLPGGPQLQPGDQLTPGTTLPGGQYVGNDGDGNYFCDDDWCYQYYGDNSGNGTTTPGTTTAPGYNDYDNYGGNYGGYDDYDGGYYGGYYDTGDYYGDYSGYDYGDDYYGDDYGTYSKTNVGSVDSTGNYRGKWANGWSGGWYYYSNDFYLDSRLNALQRTRTPGTAAKLKIRARARG